MNSINLIGRLTRDPEARAYGDGKTMCSFTLAVNDTMSREERTDFIRITVFGKSAENCQRYLHKGSLAGVSGRLRIEAYTDKEGAKKSSTSVTADRVEFLSWANKDTDAEGRPKPQDNDDDMPF